MDTLRRQLPNVLSISRIPASAVFVLAFSSSDPLGYWMAVLLALGALITDFADGYFARKWKAVSETGYFLDGLGDKCFTIGFCLVISRVMPNMVLLMWALITRELLLYGLRAIDPSKTRNLQQLRWISLWQAASIRLSFGLFLLISGFQVYAFDAPGPLQLPFILSVAFAAAFGWTSVVLLALRLARNTNDTP